ncbi:AbrB/MazE/SpoVT family DNA-binding domain-containing protein [Fusobacterium varium]|uniref:AbrB/MazE/SpoVT family DNA-binding domain-containing protein n=1 Tax=Fusobacterium varium TaxID=856 RepID=UPI00266C5635|nr:AbrB/MazE/SpoVT family DNA-binding domain-containing protein [Fusobacterium varium]
MTITGNICKWGNGQAIRIPKAILDFLKWTEDDKFELITENGELKIKKIEEKKKRKNIKELFEGYNKTYTAEGINWGEPVGEEIW